MNLKVIEDFQVKFAARIFFFDNSYAGMLCRRQSCMQLIIVCIKSNIYVARGIVEKSRTELSEMPLIPRGCSPGLLRHPQRNSCSAASSSAIGLNSSLQGRSFGTRRLGLPSALAAAALSLKSRSLARRVRRGSETLRRELEESQEVREEVRFPHTKTFCKARRVLFATTNVCTLLVRVCPLLVLLLPAESMGLARRSHACTPCVS